MRRFELDGHARFLTFSCYQRLPLLNHDGIRQLFLDRLAKLLAEQQVRLLGWVLMPEHAHLIVFPEADPDMRRFTHSLKRPVAEAVLRGGSNWARPSSIAWPTATGTASGKPAAATTVT
jgi:putative transposase